MGVCYRILRDDKRESFDLNKGYWPALFPHGPFTLAGEGLSRDAMITRIVTGVWRSAVSFDPENGEYAALIADRIIEWSGDAVLRVISDTGWDTEWFEYSITADRFSPSYVPGYKDFKDRGKLNSSDWC